MPLPAPPTIPGLRFRPLGGRRDYAGMVAVHRACAEVDGLDEVVTEAELANFVENADSLDPSLDITLADVEGRAVAYSWISHRLQTAGDELHFHRGYVHPAWRRRGLGAAMLHQMTRRAEACRLGSVGRRFLQSYIADGEVSAAALLSSRGYAPVRYSFKMVRDLSQPIPDLPLPSGLEVRPAEAAHFRAIWEAEREAFQDHWGYAPWPEENYQRFLAFPHYDPSLWRVAWDGDQVAGSVLSYIHPEENSEHGRLRGYTEDISVRRPWRRRGLASALIARSLAALKERGMTEAALEVDSENPTGALRVYQRLGFTAIWRRSLFRRALGAPAA
ncbi:MAG TPA: GNAT family N-acetyltransferase [Anaerolineales bacterium]|nr:GNAT family N-acetyltransferase [Anaerolineales bacterium]